MKAMKAKSQIHIRKQGHDKAIHEQRKHYTMDR